MIGALKQTAEHNLDGKIKQAVMSVPAEFTEVHQLSWMFGASHLHLFELPPMPAHNRCSSFFKVQYAHVIVACTLNSCVQAQRNATIKAGALAGLEVLRILSEPTAAAMAYGLHTKDMVTYIVVFDFGGGTLDVSLLWKQGGMFITHAIAGNKHLGGEDLSHAFFEFALEKLEALHGGPVTSPAGRQRLRTQVENAKHALSTDTIATVKKYTCLTSIPTHLGATMPDPPLPPVDGHISPW